MVLGVVLVLDVQGDEVDRKMNAQRFGLLLNSLREKAGLTARDLAARAHINESYVSELQNGRVQFPRPSTIAKLAKALGVAPQVFYDESLEKISSVTMERYDIDIGKSTWLIVRGSIPCGNFTDVTEQNMGKVECLLSLLAGASDVNAVYACRVNGTSLEGDDIHDGDMVAIDPNQKQPINGKIYAIRMDNEMAARHVWKENGHYRLSSSIPSETHSDITPDQFEILGRIIGAWKPPKTY